MKQLISECALIYNVSESDLMNHMPKGYNQSILKCAKRYLITWALNEGWARESIATTFRVSLSFVNSVDYEIEREREMMRRIRQDEIYELQGV